MNQGFQVIKTREIKSLEAKNDELEKKLVEAEKAFEDKKRALTAAINMWDTESKKLEIAVEALGFISQNSSCSHMEDIADKALAAIKGKG
jgi:SMC interacting uncharacterized protein involved in chromosome segregation